MLAEYVELFRRIYLGAIQVRMRALIYVIAAALNLVTKMPPFWA